MAQRSKREEIDSAEELCRQAFSRCSNWPADFMGQSGLVDGLKLAADRYGVTQQELIARCRETSAFCPTDADLLRVAHDLDAERKRRTAGTPPWMRLPTCDVCGDTGWKFRLNPGGYDFVQRCPKGCKVPDQARFGGAA